jgi:Nif-specific regulatory protein
MSSQLSTKCRDSGCLLSREGPTLEMLSQATGLRCRSVQELSLLFAVSETMSRSLDLTDIVRPVLRRLQDLLGLERGTIVIFDAESSDFFLSEAVGIPRSLDPGHYLELIQPQLAKVVATGEAAIVADLAVWARKRELDPAWIEALSLDRGVGLACVPLLFEKKVLGTLSIERCRNSTVGWETDLRLLTMISSIIAQAARVRQQAAEKIQNLQEENDRLQAEIALKFRPKNMVGTSAEMQDVYHQIEHVAESTTTVLLRGESGTGKELVAKALHERSQRKNKPIVKFNCAALPDSIIESELFGHEKGAFTGAIQTRKGRFETAEGGTIFLDEIGDISATTQVKLLRVLQEKEFERVGSQTTLRSDVRVVAATSRNLEEMIEQGTFREDLYYRLNVFPIYIPPLRSRKSDLLLLADHFIEKYSREMGLKPSRISSAAIDLLVSYHWPGNVRELENCIERAVILAKGKSLKAHHLPPTLLKKTTREREDLATLEEALSALEREMIIDSLKETGSNMAESARRLGLTERKVGLRVKKYDIDLERYRK